MVETLHTIIGGRARFRVQELYRSKLLGEFLGSRLRRHPHIKDASINILTATVLVYFNSGNTPETISTLIDGFVQEHGRINSAAVGTPGRIPTASNSSPSRPASETKKAEASPRIRRVTQPIQKGSPTGMIPSTASWHTLEPEIVLQRFESSAETGLTAQAAAESLARYGPNGLPEARGRSRFNILADQFTSLPVALLTGAAVFSVLTGGLADGAAILGAVALNAAIGFLTELEAERTIDSLKSLARPSTHLLRDGKVIEIAMEAVVPGDILVLRPGSYVGADARVVAARQLTVDESALTGESLPVSKKVGALHLQSIALGDRINMVYMGTLVTGGQGLAVVVATGPLTELGRLQALLSGTSTPRTPMERQLDGIGNQLVIIGAAACAVVFATGLLHGHALAQVITMSISVAVAAIPEGLPTVATTCLAVGLGKMKRRNVLIRKLECVETLGGVQTICFDKTGTVTENRMTVLSLHVGMRKLNARDGTIVDNDEPVDLDTMPDLAGLLSVCILCSESRIGRTSGGFRFKGSPTENALMHMALNSGLDLQKTRGDNTLLRTSLRTEDRHFMTTLHEKDNGEMFIAMKGSPTEVLDLCDRYVEAGVELPLTEDAREDIERENNRMAGKALRVLGFAVRRNVTEGDFDAPCGLVWLGLVGMADPVRNGVKDLIAQFHQAGIETIMITGDQSPTAYAVGKELNLSQGEAVQILDSSHLNAIDENALGAIAKRVHVFSRVSPANKLQIVQALQKTGRVVAMTGDGINDGPALKAADIGVTLGGTGTDIAREVADIILENDNLETMIVAVGQGRTIQNNIRKSIHFLLSTNMSEILLMVCAGTVGLGYPLTAMQLLWINLLSDIFPGLALGMEAEEPNVLKRPPRDPNEPIINRSDIRRIGFESATLSASALGAYLYGVVRYGKGVQAGTLAFQGLSIGQIFHSLSCRSETHSLFDKENLPPNPYLRAAVVGSGLLQVLTMLLPGLRSFLGLAPLGLLDAGVVAGAALLPLVVNEATKRPAGNDVS